MICIMNLPLKYLCTKIWKSMVCITIIVALLGGVTVYLAREKSEGVTYDREPSADSPDETGTVEIAEFGSDEDTIIRGETAADEDIELSNIKTVISPNEMSCFIALDEGGRVWKWEEGKTKEEAVLIEELEDIVKILDTGYGSVYALSVEGDVYAWGNNWGWLTISCKPNAN